MRIGIDARLWNETGVGRYIRNLVEQLLIIDKTNDYVLFVRFVDSQNIKNQILKIKNEFKIENLKLKIVNCNIHWHSLDEQVKFPQVLYKEKLDLMHFPYFSLPVFYTRPFVVTIHDLIINHFPTGKASTLPYPLYHIKRLGYNLVMDYAVKKSQRIIVPLKAVKDDVMQTFNLSDEKIVVTYEGVEEKSKIKNQKLKTQIKEQKYFLYVGNAYPHKNLERLIEAFGLFKKEITDDVKLILVGKDDYFYKRLHRKIEQNRMQNIIFKHDVSDEELFALYAKAKAFVSPSLMEGFGLPPLEAMSASCPVILSDIPSFREVCQDAGNYFDPLSLESLQEQLYAVYTMDQKKREEKIKTGLERVKKFSWKKMAEETLEIYNKRIIQ